MSAAQSTAVEVDWDRIRDGSDCVLIDGFRRDLDGNYPAGTVRLGDVAHGGRVVDRAGNRFRVIGHGAVQGSVVIRDRYRRQYQTDISTVVSEVS